MKYFKEDLHGAKGRTHAIGPINLTQLHAANNQARDDLTGADDDGILDQLEPTSYTFTTTRSTQLTILDEVFTPNDEPADEPADINGDGKVDGQDLAALLGAWGSDDSQADINGDGVVDGQDLAELLGTWN